MNDKPQKIELNNLTELSKVKESNYIVNIFNHPKRSNSSKDLINDEEDELLYTIKFDKETNKPIVSLIHSTSKSDIALIPTLKCLIVPNRDNMGKPKIIINSHSKEEQFKLILDTGSNVSLINKRLISKEIKNHVHKTKAKINFPLLYVKEDQINCNVKAPRKHVTLSNDNGILQSLEIPFEVWREISIDFLSLPKTMYALNGFKVEVDQVCVIVCRLSKMVHIFPCHKTIDAEHTAQLLLNHVFRIHGYPRTIVSDRDPIFLSDIWSRWAKTMNSKLNMTSETLSSMSRWNLSFSELILADEIHVTIDKSHKITCYMRF
ncbi:hypothetical protein ACTFIY_003865 [Dictyostelium cf. discoideum]